MKDLSQQIKSSTSRDLNKTSKRSQTSVTSQPSPSPFQPIFPSREKSYLTRIQKDVSQRSEVGLPPTREREELIDTYRSGLTVALSATMVYDKRRLSARRNKTGTTRRAP